MRKLIIANDILVQEVSRLVAEGSEVTFVPKGNSMLPFIRGGVDSVVLVKADDVGVMDIVLARANSTFVIHRIIAMDGDEVVLMGDGNIAGVERCSRKEVLAKVAAIVKDGRRRDCTGGTHGIKARIWRGLLPLRRYLLAIYRRLT